ncbi:hypothetical protein [Entomobacter blattae]|uniref:Uncharacterized protein n=1 Tax=Entomobacter blattae TaxID=2762277 RepID=A0A7H1NRJ3_9PROT|nr:hypothetical protein [Entomobacter blattae]QNT78403.1 hypothetical protein JGUZn3_11770 [Entomobacter blattae]
MRDPNYWVQYAMAHLSHKSLDYAKKHLETAKNLAKNIENYNTDSIDTQTARLYLLLSLQETDQNKIFQSFKEAHDLLIKISNTIYRYRQVLIYKDFYDVAYTRLSTKNKVNFKACCEEMKKELEEYRAKNSNNWVSENCYEFLQKIT